MRSTVRPLLALLLSVSLLSSASSAIAQAPRLSDKDVQHLMENLRDDSKSFQDPFKDALSKSSIRKTSQEKDARQLSKTLAQQTNSMLNTFKSTHRAEAAFANVTATVNQIDPIVTSLGNAPKANERWNRVHADLQALAPAFGQ